MKPIRAMAAAVVLLVAMPTHAQESVVERWYAALLKVDRAALSDLLTDDATIKLDDLGVTQTKAEFIGSMDEWQAAAKGANIRHKVESQTAETTTVLTCYDFPENDLLARETFTTKNERIVANTQVTVGDGCMDF